MSRCIDRHQVRRLSRMTHVGRCSARSAASLPGLDTTRARAVRMRSGSAPKSRKASVHDRGSSLQTTSTVPASVSWPAHGCPRLTRAAAAARIVVLPDAFGPRINPIVPRTRALARPSRTGPADRPVRSPGTPRPARTCPPPRSVARARPFFDHRTAKDRHRHRARRLALDSPDDRDPQGRRAVAIQAPPR